MATKPPKIEVWPLDRFRPYDRNARTHPQEQIDRMVKMIREVGFRDPVEVLPDGEILAGHGRLEAARAAGLTEVPVIIWADMTVRQGAAYRIANNKAGELSGWDRLVLASELHDLKDAGPLPELGFTDDELAKLEAELTAATKPPAGGDGGDGSSRGLGQAVISYVLVFDDADQQDVWFEFVRHLRRLYPDGDTTVAAMLTTYLQRCLSDDEHDDD